MLKRLADAGAMERADWDDLAPTLDQLNFINSLRNDILHHGANWVAEGRGTVTNAMMALTEERITSFAISPAILDDMTADLRKIILHMLVRHAGRPAPKAPYNRQWIDSVLREPWRYTQPPSPPPKKNRPSKQAQAAPPKPSER
jgi:hypothetical protein